MSQILFSLGTLNRYQLDKVKQRVSFLLQHRTNTTSVENEDWLLLGILNELRRRGLDDRDTFRLKKVSSYASFNTQSENVRSLLLKVAPDLTAIQRRALGETAAKALADFISTWTPPRETNRENLLMLVSKIPEALDWAFPGYMAAGMLGMVVR